ncbi:MAG TPA: hypothetical protein VK923_02450 [Euzebyales bacterium]|nr:hypothetical protein [Euzebyales bacterium]
MDPETTGRRDAATAPVSAPHALPGAMQQLGHRTVPVRAEVMGKLDIAALRRAADRTVVA